MTTKPTQHSVAIVGAIRDTINGTIGTLLDSLSAQSEQLEQAFMAELAHLDELYTDTMVEDGTALESVQRFDKGYAKTMAAIQAATERLVEARAHIAQITNTIEFHSALDHNFKEEGHRCQGDSRGAPYPVTKADATIDISISGTLDREVVSMQGATSGKTDAVEGHTVEYNLLPINDKGLR